MTTVPSNFPRVIRDVRVYSKGRIQIPSTIIHETKLKDGQRVKWIEWQPGTYLVEIPKDTYRPFS